MVRYPYRQQPQTVDTGDVPYVSYISEQAEPLMMQAAANAQQRYDLAQTAIAKYLEENAAAKFRDVDYNTAMAKLNQELENIKTTVKDKYDNQYGRAYPEILKGLSKARQTYHLAQKAYEEEQKYAPLITKLAAEKKLIFAPNAKEEVVDPRTQSVFNEKGEYVGGLDYSNIRERSDYDKTIEDAIVKGIDKTSDDTGLGRRLNGYFEQIKTKGLAALGNTPDEINKKVRELAEQYTPIFEAQTTYGIDPDKPMESSTDFIEKTIHRLAGSDKDINYREDILGREAREAGRKPKNVPFNFRATYEEPVTINPETEAEVKEIENAITISKTIQNTTRKKNILGKLQVGNTSTVISDAEEKSFNNNPITSALREKWRTGNATLAEGVALFGTNLAEFKKTLDTDIPNSVTKGIKNLVTDRTEKLKLYETVGNILGASYTDSKGKIKIADEPVKGSDAYIKRSNYLELLADNADEYNIVKDKNGFYTFKYPERSGFGAITEDKQRAVRTKANNAIVKILQKGDEGLAAETSENIIKLQTYLDKNPFIVKVAQDIVTENPNIGDMDAMTMAMEVMENTKKSNVGTYSYSMDLNSSSSDRAANNFENNYFTSKLKENVLSTALNPDDVKKIIVDKKGRTASGETTFEDLKTSVNAGITGSRLNMNNLTISILTNDANKYNIPINKVLPAGVARKTEEAQKFLKQGAKLEFAKQEGDGIKEHTPTINIAGVTFKQDLRLSEDANGKLKYVPKIQMYFNGEWVDDDKVPGYEGSSAFNQMLSEYVFSSLIPITQE